MPKVEVDLPERIHDEIDHLVEQDEFVNREQVYEELLAMGVSSYDVEEEPAPEASETLFTQSVEDQQDPALRDDPGRDTDEFPP